MPWDAPVTTANVAYSFPGFLTGSSSRHFLCCCELADVLWQRARLASQNRTQYQAVTSGKSNPVVVFKHGLDALTHWAFWDLRCLHPFFKRHFCGLNLSAQYLADEVRDFGPTGQAVRRQLERAVVQTVTRQAESSSFGNIPVVHITRLGLF